MSGESWLRPFVAEFVGTLFLVFIGTAAVASDHLTGGQLGLLGVALAHGLALAVAVSATAASSGGHLNPAVSVALWATGRLPLRQLPVYLVAQLLAGVVAAGLLLATFPAEHARAVRLGAPGLAAGVTPAQGVLLEALLTFLLVFAVFGTAVDPRAPRIGGFGIGLTVLFDILAGGPLTGAAMNPARAFGPALVAGAWQDHLVYWVGPLLGALVAAFLYDRVLMPAGERPGARG